MGPQVSLKSLRRVPDSAQCVHYAMNGNTEGLKDLFNRGLASPWDVSSTRGYTLSRVSHRIVVDISLTLRRLISISGHCTQSSTRLPNFLLGLVRIQIIGTLTPTARHQWADHCADPLQRLITALATKHLTTFFRVGLMRRPKKTSGVSQLRATGLRNKTSPGYTRLFSNFYRSHSSR